MLPSSTLFTFFLLSIIIFVSSQLSSPSASLENGNVKLTFNVPTSLREDIAIIKLDRGDGSQSQNVLFFYKSDLSTKVDAAYTNRLTVITSALERKVEITLPGVQSRDAGMYKCWDGTGVTATLLPNCGHKLIIVRKPKPPSILSLTSALEGQTLKLSCNTSSTSLPPDHGLNLNILWRDEQNTIIGIPAGNKFVMNADGHLEILNIQRLDRGRKFTCTSSDKADNINNAPFSDPSLPYEIKPECASRGHEYSEAHPPYDTVVRGGIKDEHEYSVIAKTSLVRYSNVSTKRDKDNIQDIDNTSTQDRDEAHYQSID